MKRINMNFDAKLDVHVTGKSLKIHKYIYINIYNVCDKIA